MRRSALALLAAGVLVAPLPQQPAVASCAGPSVDLAPQSVLRRGESLDVAGRHFVDGCQDSMSCDATWGCDDCEVDDPPPTAMQDVELRLVQRGRTWALAEADADAGTGLVSWSFTLPPGVRPGPARLDADGLSAVRVRIR